MISLHADGSGIVPVRSVCDAKGVQRAKLVGRQMYEGLKKAVGEAMRPRKADCILRTPLVIPRPVDPMRPASDRRQ
jgi:hypothetical protein